MYSTSYTIRAYLVGNINDLETKTKEVERIAFYDNYTDLPNHNLFLKIIKERDESIIKSGYIILLRIQNLDVINSIYGEQIGGEVITKIKKAISETIKDEDLLAKNTGKEFVVWLENIAEDQLMKWFCNINRIFNEIKVDTDNNIQLDILKSYSEYKPGGLTFDECYNKACIALVYAKLNNLTEIISYNKDFEHALYNEEILKESLIRAIKHDEFYIKYQPKVDVLTGEIIGVEALARWNSGIFGEISPSIFVPIVEKINKSVEFGELIIDKVFKEYNLICKKYNNIIVSINISPSHLLAKGFEKYLVSKLNQYYIKSNTVVIEITEEVLLQNQSKTTKILTKIRNLGIGISLDDFGTGYSSYSYLMKYDIDELKIDKSFIDQLCINEKSEILLKSIIYIAKSYNIRLIAEGVETEAQKDRLIKLGCGIVQGYLTGKPETL